MKGSVLGGVAGPERVDALRRHRYAVWEATMNDFISGRCPLSYLLYRTKLLTRISHIKLNFSPVAMVKLPQRPLWLASKQGGCLEEPNG